MTEKIQDSLAFDLDVLKQHAGRAKKRGGKLSPKPEKRCKLGNHFSSSYKAISPLEKYYSACNEQIPERINPNKILCKRVPATGYIIFTSLKPTSLSSLTKPSAQPLKIKNEHQSHSYDSHQHKKTASLFSTFAYIARCILRSLNLSFYVLTYLTALFATFKMARCNQESGDFIGAYHLLPLSQVDGHCVETDNSYGVYRWATGLFDSWRAYYDMANQINKMDYSDWKKLNDYKGAPYDFLREMRSMPPEEWSKDTKELLEIVRKNSIKFPQGRKLYRGVHLDHRTYTVLLEAIQKREGFAVIRENQLLSMSESREIAVTHFACLAKNDIGILWEVEASGANAFNLDQFVRDSDFQELEWIVVGKGSNSNGSTIYQVTDIGPELNCPKDYQSNGRTYNTHADFYRSIKVKILPL